MRRGALSRSRRREAAPALAAAKLALTEFLLGADDARECAERGVAWLCEHGGAQQATCLLIERGDARLIGVATHGVPREKVEKYAVDLEERDHPLVLALDSWNPSVVVPGPNGRQKPLLAPFRAASLLAVPLRATDLGGAPGGLLLVAPVTPALRQSAAWLASVLGPAVVRRRSLRTLTEAERRLTRERTLLTSIINAVSDPILLTDTEGRMMIANTRAETLFAARESESEGRRRAIALNNMFLSSALGRRAVEDVETSRREMLVVDPDDGSDLLFELLSAVASHPREGTGIVSVLRNVTDLRKATEEIEENYRKLRVAEVEARAERDRLDLIIDSVADPIVVSNPSGATILMNTPAERLFTVPAEAALEETTQRVRANDAHFSSFVSNLFFASTGLRYRGSLSLVDPQTGVSIPVEAVAGKILSEHGEVSAVVTILHDQTEAMENERLYAELKRASEGLEQKVREATAELVRHNELLRRQALELEQASALKSEFLANMSHEFRTPLNAILGYTSMLLGGVNGELQPPQRRNLARVESNARHLLAIINDILDIARIEAGKMPVHVTIFPMPDLLDEVLAELEPLIARSKLAVGRKVAPDLPEIGSDRAKVKQIVLNLLANAIKFTPEGSATVSASYDASRDEVSVAVTDTGIGIAEADQEKIFEDFRQADNSPTREYGGTGLGLSISRRLANMLGGRITLVSRLGQGSTFTLVLPRKPRR